MYLLKRNKENNHFSYIFMTIQLKMARNGLVDFIRYPSLVVQKAEELANNNNKKQQQQEIVRTDSPL